MSPKALRCVTLAALLGLAIHADTTTAATRLKPSSDSSSSYSSSSDSSSDSSDATAPSPVPAMHVSSAPTSAAREMRTPSPAAMIASTAAPTMVMMPAGNGTAFNGTDTPSPNTPIPKPECNSTQAVSIRYSATTGRLYLEAGVEGERGGCVTVEQIWEARGGGTTTGAKAPLYAVDPVSGEYSDVITGTWLLEEDLYVEDGITLKVGYRHFFFILLAGVLDVTGY
ncbi:MEP4a [Ectocarpus sp. CCAP 1310/34]|nr:MEP4a [Ectocarpus sp. CCAP 1310/34]